MAVETRVMNCIMCPMGCEMTVTIENGAVTNVTGNTATVEVSIPPSTPARVALNMLTMKLLLRSVC